ncbi:unnamed protein product [marine sediment metagenome]|uniref:DUF2089 domain-containing protein n=1 Tax=marine sediment metagenome TaxID=412755 RepID=X0SMQ1_9ZZZZ
MPCTCPGCGRDLKAVRLACDNCGTAVEGEFTLPVLARLDAQDQRFLISFLKSSGSLKALARQYGVSYPTLRNRLDALIERAKDLEARAIEQEGG